MSTRTIPPLPKTRQLLNKVPEVTIYFWIIKCLCTTIGETMSDNLMGRFAAGGDNATPGQLRRRLACYLSFLHPHLGRPSAVSQIDAGPCR